MKFFLILSVSLTATAHAADLNGVKTYLNSKLAIEMAGATDLKAAAHQYYDLAKAANFDYKKVAADPKTRAILQAARAGWQKASPTYEDMEGIVAGVSSLSQFDTALDAGTSGKEGGDNVVKFDLKLPNGKVIPKPGNLFSVAEQTMWGTNPDWTSGVPFDIDGDGKVGFGDKLPDAGVLQATADLIDSTSKDLKKAADAWKPSREDVFGALVANVPTTGPTFYADWKTGPYVLGNKTQRRDFVVNSRLRDLLSNVASWQAMYKGLSSDVKGKNAALDRQITGGLNDLSTFVGKMVAREKTRRYTPEQAEQYQRDAQNRATAVTGKITQAAALLGVKLQ